MSLYLIFPGFQGIGWWCSSSSFGLFPTSGGLFLPRLGLNVDPLLLDPFQISLNRAACIDAEKSLQNYLNYIKCKKKYYCCSKNRASMSSPLIYQILIREKQVEQEKIEV